MSISVRSGPLAPGIAFITGGARGIGNAVAVSFAKEGAKGIALVDTLSDSALAEGKAAVEAYGTKCITIHADVTDETQVSQAVAGTVQVFGRIDYAANFAGIAGPLDATVDTETEKWKRVININCTEGRVPQLRSIVNCASVNSTQAGAGLSGYTAAKHAVLGITKTGALEAREYHIRVNCGFLRTQILETKESREDGLGGDSAESLWGQFEARQGRRAMVEEIGDVVLLLSTPRMSLVNGHNLVVDNGFTICET
ncbi:hypothetical protein BAUCODRAFT_153292 [Baudoinia panamericana UAMH 10762]|uniref:NAD(P)-binding protein n=1 Tax=Baudoinia panamericana (strain UAMH 10762) TaxID=717646 RepID=M2NMY3_BAUPA|nr:uncharacterized protein BAUCODRAFT_153292 [Baudoinia panamericana UAMH 10762]EMD00890.1 hypothetical protein BAUCODRAFT_153292 [Baudoinia panamericana UAMH 10762]